MNTLGGYKGYEIQYSFDELKIHISVHVSKKEIDEKIIHLRGESNKMAKCAPKERQIPIVKEFDPLNS